MSADLTRREAAELLGISSETLRAWGRKGYGPRFYRLSGGTVRYSREDLNQWLASRAVEPAVGSGVE